MIAHENISIQKTVISIFIGGEDLEVFLIIGRVFKYFLFLIASGNNVVEGSFKLYAGFTGHEARVTERSDTVNISMFKSDPILLLNKKALSDRPVLSEFMPELTSMHVFRHPSS